MSEMLRISAKNLGEVALRGFCPRCFWLKLQLNNRLPYQIFPGIFSTIDSYNKRIVHSWFDKHRQAPVWLKSLGELIAYREPPHYSSFRIHDRENDILLTGSPDGVFVRADQMNIIVDYKTSKYTGNQDKLFPLYAAQLNAYALIGEQCGLAPVGGLALIYMEPVADDDAARDDGNHRENGFVMGFSANVLPVPLDTEMLAPLLARTREIYDLADPPPSREGCDNCQRVENLVALIRYERE